MDEFAKLANVLIAQGQHRDLAKRYLSIRRREKLIAHACEMAQENIHDLSPLADIGFSGPLSLAGQPSILIVRGEHLRMQGIPIALEYDSAGKHLGWALDEVQEKLRQATGVAWTDVQVLDLYADYMAPARKTLASEPPRISKLPHHLNKLELLRRYLEDQLIRTLEQTNLRLKPDQRFAALVEKNTVEMALARLPAKPSLVIGFSTDGGCQIDGEPVDTRWGIGRGLVTIWRKDLERALAKAQFGITIDARSDHWLGWIDRTPNATVDKPTKPVRFAYYSEQPHGRGSRHAADDQDR